MQDYTGLAAVDDKPPIIRDAQVLGTGSEQELLIAVVNALKTRRREHTADARRLPRSE